MLLLVSYPLIDHFAPFLVSVIDELEVGTALVLCFQWLVGTQCGEWNRYLLVVVLVRPRPAGNVGARLGGQPMGVEDEVGQALLVVIGCR